MESTCDFDLGILIFLFHERNATSNVFNDIFTTYEIVIDFIYKLLVWPLEKARSNTQNLTIFMLC